MFCFFVFCVLCFKPWMMKTFLKTFYFIFILEYRILSNSFSDFFLRDAFCLVSNIYIIYVNPPKRAHWCNFKCAIDINIKIPLNQTTIKEKSETYLIVIAYIYIFSCFLNYLNLITIFFVFCLNRSDLRKLYIFMFFVKKIIIYFRFVVFFIH